MFLISLEVLLTEVVDVGPEALNPKYDTLDLAYTEPQYFYDHLYYLLLTSLLRLLFELILGYVL
jgi:hypothetical protein